jgi:hypothetical protein
VINLDQCVASCGWLRKSATLSAPVSAGREKTS